MSRVFLSHSSRDNVAAEALKTWLEQNMKDLDGEIFFDRDIHTGIHAGERWKDSLRRASDRCEVVICLVSKAWDESKECLAEFRAAEYRGKPVLPARLEPDCGALVTREWQRCDLFGDGPKTTVTISVGDTSHSVEFLTDGLGRMQEGLRAIGIAPDNFTWPPPAEPNRSPYRGWRPIESVDAAVYFGRDLEINRALTAIRALRNSAERKALAILGPSGVGKSSFLRAGVLPRLQRDDRHFLTMDVVRPERQPLTGQCGLAQSIHALRTSLGLGTPDLGVIKAGVGNPRSVHDWLSEAQDAALEGFVNGSRPAAPTLILPIDQAEELFGPDVGPEADTFLRLLAALLDGEASDLPIIAVATIRSDRYESFQTDPHLSRLDACVFDDLKPMRPDRFRDVICKPVDRLRAAGTKLEWDPDVVEDLVRESAGADALPLLSLTLATLYEDYGGDGQITLDEYKAMGGMRQVVESVIDGQLSTDTETREAELDLLRQAFIPWLATIDPNTDQPMRRVARWFDLPADSHRLIDALVAQRLMVKDERNGETVVEVALESLLRQWDALAGWLADEATDLKAADSLDADAKGWERSSRQDDWLLPGNKLTAAEALAAKPGFRERLNTAREYLLASRQADDRRVANALRVAQEHQKQALALAEAERLGKEDAEHRTRVLRAVLALTTVVALVAFASAWWAVDARNDERLQARIATAQRLLAKANAVLAGQSSTDDDDVLGIQLLLAAQDIMPTADAEADFQIRRVVNDQRDLIKILDTPARVYSVGISPDGKRILAASADDSVKLWDATSGLPIGAPLHADDQQVTSVAFSPNGGIIAAGSSDGTIRLWSVSGIQVGQPLRGHEDAVVSVAFNRDGSQLVSGSLDSTVRVWNVAGGPARAVLRGHRGAVRGVAFSPDDSLIASAGADNTVRLWKTSGGYVEIAQLTGHTKAVLTVAFSPDGAELASGSEDHTVRLWNTHDHNAIEPPLRGHADNVYSVAFSPDGNRIASASGDSTIRLWDARAHQQIGAPLRGHDAAVYSVAFSPDSSEVVSASADNTVRVWDAVRWRPILGQEDVVQRAVFRPGATSIVANGDDRSIRSWDAVTGRPVGTPVGFDAREHRNLVVLDATRAMTVDKDGTAQLWNTGPLVSGPAPARPIPIGKPLPGPVDAGLVRYSPVGILAIPVTPERIELHDTTGMRRDQSITLSEPLRNLAFAPGGDVLAILGTGSAIRLWDTATGTALGEPMTVDPGVSDLTFTHDGHSLAAWGGLSLRLWDVDRRVAKAGAVTTGAPITAVAFSFDGRLLAAGMSSGSIDLWDLIEGRRLPAFDGQGGRVVSLDFNPRGTKLLSANTGGTVQVWPIISLSREALCAKLTHNISERRWREWVPASIGYMKACPNLDIAEDGERTA